MQPVSDTFRDIVARSHTRVARVSVLDALLNPVAGGVLSGEAGVAVSGSVTMDRRRDVQRTVRLDLANEDGALTPRGPNSLFYWDRLIRVERGVRIGQNQEEYATLGTFIIDSPEVDIASGRSSVGVAGADQMDRLLRSKFTAPTTYAAGATLRSVVSSIAVAAGANANHLSLNDGGKTLAVSCSYEIGEERIKALRELVQAYALEFFADAYGVLVLRPSPDPNLLPTAWTFVAGEDAITLGVSKRWSKDRLYNHILVTGERADQTPVYGEASDTNASSPTYINGPLGDRLFTYTSAMITTVAQAQEVARALLYEHALVEEEIRLPFSPNPLLEVGDVIDVVEPLSDTTGRYIIDELTMPIGEGSATLVTRRLRSVL